MNIVCFGNYANVVTVHQWDALENACHQSTNPIRVSKHLRRSHPESDQSLTRINANYIIYIQPIQFENEIRSHLSQKALKGRFLKSEKLENHSNKEKGKEKKKARGEEKQNKTMVALSFYNSFFGDSFWPKKTVGRKRSIWR